MGNETGTTRSRGRWTVLTGLALVVGCGGADDAAEDAGPPAPAGASVVQAEAERPPRITPRAGPPGTEVRVSMENLAIAQTVGIGFGTMAGHEVLGPAEADRQGALDTTITVPASAAPGPHFVLVMDEQDQPLAVSNVFQVTDPAGGLTLTGRVTAEGVECATMRGAEGELYTLTGELGDVAPGDLVEVQGTLAEMSFCQQGTTVAVERLRRLP